MAALTFVDSAYQTIARYEDEGLRSASHRLMGEVTPDSPTGFMVFRGAWEIASLTFEGEDTWTLNIYDEPAEEFETVTLHP